MKKDVTAFIRELLFGHDCVIVPGFGGFIGNYTPARIEKSTGLFTPPVKQISFNRNLNHNDGLLIGKISESAGMNYGDSRALVEEFVADMRRKLDKGDKVIIEHIGTFYNNSENNIQFEPDKGSNFLLNSYGLTSFQCMPVEGYDVRKRVVGYRDKDQSGNRTFRKVLWRAAVIVPLVAAIVFSSVKTGIFDTFLQQTSMNPLTGTIQERSSEPTPLSVVAEPEALEPAAVYNATSTVEVEAEPVSSTADPVTATELPAEKPVITGGEYMLIAGSFKSEANANVLIGKLEGEGYTPGLEAAPNGFYRVSARSFDNLGDALNEKTVLEQKFPGVWIHKAR